MVRGNFAGRFRRDYGVASTSPCKTANQASGAAAHARHADRDLFELTAVGEPGFDDLGTECRRDGAVSPETTPPRAVLGCREAPHRGRRHDCSAPRFPRPGQEATSRIGFAVVAAGDRLVELHPPIELGNVRVPRHCRVVGVAHRDHAIRGAHAAHLTQRGDRIAEVLEHLVGVHDVEGRVGQVEVVHVADLEPGVRRSGLVCRATSVVDDVVRPVDAEHGARCDPCRELERDGSRAAPDVEHARQDAGTESRRPPSCRPCANDAIARRSRDGRACRPRASVPWQTPLPSPVDAATTCARRRS